MSVPKKKLTRRKVRSRRSHHALSKVKLAICPKCKKKVKPHIACSFCGYYKGNMVIDVEKKLAKKRTKREQKKAEKEQEKESASAKATADKGAKKVATETQPVSPDDKKSKDAKKIVV